MCVIMVGVGLCFNLNKELRNLIVYPIMQSKISQKEINMVIIFRYHNIPTNKAYTQGAYKYDIDNGHDVILENFARV